MIKKNYSMMQYAFMKLMYYDLYFLQKNFMKMVKWEMALGSKVAMHRWPCKSIFLWAQGRDCSIEISGVAGLVTNKHCIHPL